MVLVNVVYYCVRNKEGAMRWPILILGVGAVWDLTMSFIDPAMSPLYARVSLSAVQAVTAWGLFEAMRTK